ncbi:MAG: TVP38/TMEM64 family protein [Candidatus Puniceispirillaceae bacterium]
MASTLRGGVKRFWLPALLVGGLGLFLALGGRHIVSWQTIALHYADLKATAEAHLLLAATAFLGIYVIAVAFSLPIALPLTLTGGALFGWLAAGLVIVGATAGAAVVFIAARTAFADLARERAGPFLSRLEDGFSRNAFSYLLALRLIPAAPFWVVNIVPALTRMRLGSFVLATFIGIAPGTTVFVSVGRGFDHILGSGSVPDLQALGSPAILGPLAALGLLALLPVVWRRIRKAWGKETSS